MRAYRTRPTMLGTVIALSLLLTISIATSATAALLNGSLPAAGFTYTSTAINEVNMAGSGVHLKTKGMVNVKTTYSRVAPNPAFQAGWHYHNGPVIVTVTIGTLTFFNRECGTWDLSAGSTYIESTGEVLNARVLPARNVGVATVEWFTTRLYDEDEVDPVPVDPPCAM